MERRDRWEPTLILSSHVIDGELPKHLVRPLLWILINGFRQWILLPPFNGRSRSQHLPATNILMDCKLNKHA